MAGLNYSIQISPYDCTGCEVCVQSCPDNALYMENSQKVHASGYRETWNYARSLPSKENPIDKMTVKGSQFEQPLLEFSGACAGCGETPYVKLLTQLFGQQLVTANSSGCSSVWSGSAGISPFTTKDGKGPAWGRSLFEDTAEYAFGIKLANDKLRERLHEEVNRALKTEKLNEELRHYFSEWLHLWQDSQRSQELQQIIENKFKNIEIESQLMRDIRDNVNLFGVQSVWAIGGDGWAYDIGFNGLDHCISKSKNLNFLVLDTEMYSNTGGQVSKSTPLAVSIKYDLAGKTSQKKNLGFHAMNYGHVYVASVAMGANYNQCVKAFQEAESYDGPSIIFAYSPCKDWGIDMKYMMDIQKDAVESGYWPLYRYDPRKENPLQLDSKKIKKELQEFLDKQNRFQKLKRDKPEIATNLQAQLKEHVQHIHGKLNRASLSDNEMLDFLKKTMGEKTSQQKSLILYGSETGQAELAAHMLEYELKRRSIKVQCISMDDYDFEDLPQEKMVYLVVSTCGQGEYPNNAKDFMKKIQDHNLPKDFLEGVKFATYGLGDSGYAYFNKSAKDVDKHFQRLGAQKIKEIALGDDKDEDRWETNWNDWLPEVFNECNLPQPNEELPEMSFNVNILQSNQEINQEQWIPQGTKLVQMTKNQLISGEGYERDIRHYQFDVSPYKWNYSLGDCLAIYPHNQNEQVLTFLDDLKLKPDQILQIEPKQNNIKSYLRPNFTLKQFFTEVLDVFGKPNRRFYESLSILAQSDQEKNYLKHLLSKSGQKELRELIKETVTYADLIKMFPSASLKLDQMIEFIPQIKPRLYSIASSQELTGYQINLCVIENKWTTQKGTQRKGLTTNYLKGIQEGQKVATKISAGGINVPEDHKNPFVMVGLGTGIAPLRAMIQDRYVAKQNGQQVEEMALFYGVRNSSNEYSYGNELEQYHDNGLGVLTYLSKAFSRDQAEKIYVQDRMRANADILYDLLYKKKGYYYLCGPAGNIPEQARKAIINAFVEVGGQSYEEADRYITKMQIDGRYNLDVW